MLRQTHPGDLCSLYRHTSNIAQHPIYFFFAFLLVSTLHLLSSYNALYAPNGKKDRWTQMFSQEPRQSLPPGNLTTSYIRWPWQSLMYRVDTQPKRWILRGTPDHQLDETQGLTGIDQDWLELDSNFDSIHSPLHPLSSSVNFKPLPPSCTLRFPGDEDPQSTQIA